MAVARWAASRRLVLVICTCALAAGCTSESAAPTPSTSSSASAAASLNVADPAAAIAVVGTGGDASAARRKGLTVYDGTTVVRNNSGRPLRIVSVSFGSTGQNDAVEMVHAGLVRLRGTDPEFAVTNSFPPVPGTGLVLSDFNTEELLPGDADGMRYQIVLQLRTRHDGVWRPERLTVAYDIAGVRYSIELPYRLRVCVSEDPGASC